MRKFLISNLCLMQSWEYSIRVSNTIISGLEYGLNEMIPRRDVCCPSCTNIHTYQMPMISVNLARKMVFDDQWLAANYSVLSRSIATRTFRAGIPLLSHIPVEVLRREWDEKFGRCMSLKCRWPRSLPLGLICCPCGCHPGRPSAVMHASIL